MTQLPEATQVLEALTRAGVFEPDGRGTALEWAPAEAAPPRRRRVLAVGLLIALIVGGAVGTRFYALDRQAKDRAAAEALLTGVDATLRSARGGQRAPADELARAFTLDPRSPHAARSWVHAQVLEGLTRGPEYAALTAPLARAHAAGVPEAELAFAVLAAALFDGDTLRAMRLLAEWDARAGHDARYQLVAGLALERAGAASSTVAERFLAATHLDPELRLARIASARHLALSAEPADASAGAKRLQATDPTLLEAVALVALAWTREPPRARAAPDEVRETLQREAELPRYLQVVPTGLRAIEAGANASPDRKAAWSSIERGLELAETPDEACWLGEIALGIAGDGSARLARHAALRAATLAPAHRRTRRLAARVALLDDRLAEAARAVEGLDAADPQAALVRAITAYEALDAQALAAAVTRPPGVGEPPKATKGKAGPPGPAAPMHSARMILLGTTLLASQELLALASTESPWAELLAMDSALDAGDLATASQIAEVLSGPPGAQARPGHALRLARLARYRGKLDDAEQLSKLALDGSPTRRAVLERLFVLVTRKDHKGAEALVLRHASVLGELTVWASAFAMASAGKSEAARARLANVSEPSPGGPVLPRLLAGATYGALRDRNAGYKFIQGLLKSGLTNPDVASSAEAVNLPPVKLRAE